MIGKINLNRIYLKHDINYYDDADESQSNLTQAFFPYVCSCSFFLSCTHILIEWGYIGIRWDNLRPEV